MKEKPFIYNASRFTRIKHRILHGKPLKKNVIFWGQPLVVEENEWCKCHTILHVQEHFIEGPLIPQEVDKAIMEVMRKQALVDSIFSALAKASIAQDFITKKEVPQQ